MSSLRRTMQRAQRRGLGPDPLPVSVEFLGKPNLDSIASDMHVRRLPGVDPGHREPGMVVFYDEAHDLRPMQAAALLEALRNRGSYAVLPAGVEVVSIGGDFMHGDK